MAGLDAAIHGLKQQDVDARDKRGHDEYVWLMRKAIHPGRFLKRELAAREDAEITKRVRPADAA